MHEVETGEREKGRNVKHNDDDDYNPVQLRPVARG